ncbi:hybrid sensor histidine kinase/response regulator transcription factor [Mangrovibacterium marinum]|uniref:histidine kinase n=1 Tax=Mangrovibacterium marinum TaxID=1639118 RepID=A0A2T5BZE9_9BACT|nr:hybrid sensor histidine kinase/response regulator transcription factor [Mangrovibacterium marinum]PTN07632.1 signal transduction histidine kinase [Mangrovibacterium marinum]
MKATYAKLFLLLSILFCSQFGFAYSTLRQQDQIRFQYYTSDDGLAQNTVDCILRDSRGFMWFGTWNGLCRFDGYSFVTYRQESEPEGLPNNFIYSLCNDSDGNIWVGTRCGLTHYIFNEERFDVPDVIDSVFAALAVNDLKLDSKGNLWVATEDAGLWCVAFDRGGEARRVENILPARTINRLYVAGDLLFVGSEAGLEVLDLTNKQAVNDYSRLQQLVQELDVRAIFADSKGNLWIGTGLGLYMQSKNGDSVAEFYHNPDDPYSLNHLAVSSIVEDASHTVIVGTLGGLNYYQPEVGGFVHLRNGNLENERLNNPFVNSMAADEDGNVWVGTDKGGINHYNIFQKPFFALVHDPANANSLSLNTVNSILKEDEVLWVGTAGGGLNRISANNTRVERLSLSPLNASSSVDNFVSSIFRDSRGDLWLGTWGGGLKRLVSFRSQQLESFVPQADDPHSIESGFVSSVCEMSPGVLLVGTESGLDIFDVDSRHFKHVDLKTGRGEAMEIGCMLLDQQRNLWLGTRNGLFRFRQQDLEQFDQLERIPYDLYLNDPSDSSSLAGNYVISLLQSSDGTIWGGTYGNGICAFVNGADGNIQFENYNQSNGLCNNVAYALAEDPAGNIWISTDKGLSKFNPAEEHFQNFFVKDGLLSDQFYWGASCADHEGNLYFGSIAGLNYFNAAEIERYSPTRKAVLTAFSVFNKPVEIGKKYHSQQILSGTISQTDRVRLSHKDAVISIEFAALDYFLPEKIAYQYKLEGVDKNWIQVPATRRFANYTNLVGGNYIFKVRASNSDGVWSDQCAELRITVHPPFYKTIWFQLFAILLLVVAVIAYIRYRTRFLEMQKRKLEALVHQRTQQIEAQKEKLEQQAFRLQRTNYQLEERQRLIEGQKLELEQQNAQIALQRDELIELNEKVKLVNQLRLRFFTNISHEFRTPLTLIIDPIEHLMKKLKGDKNALGTLKIVNRNAQRLLHLINQLLYFRRIENGKLDLRVCMGELNSFLYQVYESFVDLAQHQHIDYQFSAAEAPAESWFDAEKLENVFYNLLSNAFKYTPERGRISMRISYVTQSIDSGADQPLLCVEIHDSGVGIKEEDMPFIFERFYQVSSEKHSKLKSSGIGLALTLELVQALHGKLEVESTAGKGSCFKVLLPYTADAFDEQELDHSVVPAEVNLRGRIDVLLESVSQPDEAEQPDDEGPEDSKSKPLVLIVEDNFDLRSFLVQTLRSDYRVIGAENGKEGLSAAKKYSPELIISDVMMPEMDGIELCSRLKKDIQTSHIPVILLTARNMVENWIEGLETGADDYIPKPFNLQVLQARMTNLIEGRLRLKKMFSNPAEVMPGQGTTNPVDEEFMARVYEVLAKSYSNPDFSASQFASEMFMSRSLLYKKIRAITDLNITDFINSYKLKKAVSLIKEGKLPIADVAFKAGFNDPKYFSRIFKKFYGMTPTEFAAKD